LVNQILPNGDAHVMKDIVEQLVMSFVEIV